jgi:kynurenine formamidase
MLVDLTMPIEQGMPFNPDHFPPEITSYASIATHGWAASKIVLDSHLGTHVDAPCHFVAEGKTLDAVPIEVFSGPAQVVHLENLGAGEAISSAHLPPLHSERVLLSTGWWREASDHELYFSRYLFLAEEAARFILNAGVRLVGIDGPSIDYDGRTHVRLLEAEAIVVENLMRLDGLPDRCTVTILPLSIAKADGSPARAVAHLGDYSNGPQP